MKSHMHNAMQGWQIDLETWKKFQKRFWLFFQVIPGNFFQKMASHD